MRLNPGTSMKGFQNFMRMKNYAIDDVNDLLLTEFCRMVLAAEFKKSLVDFWFSKYLDTSLTL